VCPSLKPISYNKISECINKFTQWACPCCSSKSETRMCQYTESVQLSKKVTECWHVKKDRFYEMCCTFKGKDKVSNLKKKNLQNHLYVFFIISHPQAHIYTGTCFHNAAEWQQLVLAHYNISLRLMSVFLVIWHHCITRCQKWNNTPVFFMISVN
jgi:hypothetical protein